MLKLEDTVGLMCSDDYKDRLKGEYIQLCIRHHNLRCLLLKYSRGQLAFEPDTPSALLIAQEVAMGQYREILRQRLSIENVPVGEVIEDMFKEE